MTQIEKTKHHIIPQSKGGNSYHENIIRLKSNIHDAFHIVFANDMPHEQLIRLVTQYDMKVLQEDFVDRVLDVCDLPARSIYKRHLFKK